MVRLARLLILALLAAVVLQTVPAAAQDFDEAAETAFVAAINASRAAEGLPPLTPNADLSAVSRTWSTQLSVVGALSHNPSYSEQYPGEWSRIGENVGTMTWPGADSATLVDRLHRAFMDSSGHRANIVGDYNQVGVGVVQSGPTMWVTVNFLKGPVPTVLEAAPEVEAPRPLPRHFSRGTFSRAA